MWQRQCRGPDVNQYSSGASAPYGKKKEFRLESNNPGFICAGVGALPAVVRETRTDIIRAVCVVTSLAAVRATSEVGVGELTVPSGSWTAVS